MLESHGPGLTAPWPTRYVLRALRQVTDFSQTSVSPWKPTSRAPVLQGTLRIEESTCEVPDKQQGPKILYFSLLPSMVMSDEVIVLRIFSLKKAEFVLAVASSGCSMHWGA